MKEEFIIETGSGSLFHVTFDKRLFHHGGAFNCRQLVGLTQDFGKDDMPIIQLGDKKGKDKLKLRHLKVGVPIVRHDGTINLKSTPIAKIFKRKE
ncbi:MAG: hypothetical protein U9O94_11280 [Nanoarchaeota archaeon]|nr:hypothetical protein [Nanoarchaeota archaeon]